MNSLTKAERRRRVIRSYLGRRQLYPFQIAAKPAEDLGLVVVIPCFDEPDIRSVLASLADCERPGASADVLVVINAPSGAPGSVLLKNADAAGAVVEFAAGDAPAWLRVHALINNDLPAKIAGVGLARKLGMDEAAGRIAATPDARGVIASLDADCRVAPNYLVELESGFAAHPDCPGVSIYFEHDRATEHANEITEYELHLRYYVAGQRGAGFPYAFHTIGSALACRADAYAAQGGMNRRRGGEDFYFAQKLIALGGYRALTGTCVYPASRLSARVPFGTGPALRAAAAGEPRLTFPPQVFEDLERVCALIDGETKEVLPAAMNGISPAMNRFLTEQNFPAAHEEILANVGSDGALRLRLYRWFNAFRFLKFAQHVVRSGSPRVPIVEAAAMHADRMSFGLRSGPSAASELLSVYRAQDRLAAGPVIPLG